MPDIVSTVRHGVLGGWHTRTTFVLALSAAAVGLGNLWRFSALAGQYGGGAFVITYVICLFVVVVPVMVAEVAIGSYGRASPFAAIRLAARRSQRSSMWMAVGLLACITGLLLLSYFSVVAGWAMAYANYMQAGVFNSASAEVVGDYFAGFLAEPAGPLYWQSLFIALVVVVVALGVRRGLGTLVWLAVPALLALLGVLIRFGLDAGNVGAAREFMFSTKLIDFTPQAVLAALGQAFFTLGVGVGTGISYGAYAPARMPIGRAVLAVAVFDTMIALLAGLAVFPVVFANNMEPSMGPALAFISVPYAFGNVIQGEMFGTLFFAMLVVAALGSAVAIMEPIVGTLMQQSRLGRVTATLLAGFFVWLLAAAVTWSLAPDSTFGWFSGGNLLSWLDALTAQLLLPLVALLTAVLVGWRLRPSMLRVQLKRESDFFFSLWRFVLRYISPPAILLVMLAALWGDPGV